MKKLLIVGVVAILGALSLGAAASIGVDGGNVGSGNDVVGGFDVTATSWGTNSNGDVITVTFDITNSPATVGVQTQTGELFGGGSDAFANWACVAGAPPSFTCTAAVPVAAATLVGLTVVASS